MMAIRVYAISVVFLQLVSISVGRTLLTERTGRNADVADLEPTNTESDLELELESLQEAADDEDDSDFFEELSDVDQQRHEPDESEEGEGEEVGVPASTTPGPTTTVTIEQTRVDEPTDKGPTEPTKENASTVPTNADEDSPVVQDLRSFLTGARTTDASDVDADSHIIRSEVPPEDFSDELESIKEEKESDEPSDDLITATATTHPEHESEEKEMHSEESIEDKATVWTHTDRVSSTQASEVEVQPMMNDGGSETFTRNARKPHLSSNRPEADEDLLEMMVKMAEKPANWNKISEALGKLDYETSSKLKTALQMKALEEKNLKAAHQEAKIITMENKAPTSKIRELHRHIHRLKQNDVGKLDQPTHVELPPSPRPTLHSFDHRHGDSGVRFPPSANEHRMHTEPNHPYIHKFQPNNKNLLSTPAYHPHPALNGKGVKGGKANKDPKLERNDYNGPINTIAIDVPGTGNKPLHQKNGNNGNNGKQAYIAVTVYKPTKEKFRQIELKPKPNNNNILPRLHDNNGNLPQKEHLKGHFQQKSGMKLQKTTDFLGKEKNMHLNNNMHNMHTNNNLKENRHNDNPSKGNNKHPKLKNKNKNKNKQKQKHPGKWKHKSQTSTDEMEAQLVALSMMEKKLKEHLMQKERLRQRLRQKHHRPERDTESYM